MLFDTKARPPYRGLTRRPRNGPGYDIFRPPALASRSSCSRRGVGPSLRSAYRPAAGPRRGYRVPHARAATGVGALSTPRTAVLIPAEAPAQPAPAASQRPVLAPRSSIPPARLRLTRHQREVHAIHRVSPAHCCAGLPSEPASGFHRTGSSKPQRLAGGQKRWAVAAAGAVPVAAVGVDETVVGVRPWCRAPTRRFG